MFLVKARNSHVSRWELVWYPVAVWSTRALHGHSRNISPKSLGTDSYVDPCRIPLGQRGSNSIHGLEGLFETQTSSLRTMPWAPRADDVLFVSTDRQSEGAMHHIDSVGFAQMD